MCKVSVIVPVYNVEKYLRACLESLAAQTLDDIEVVVVNDGSPDGSLAVAEEFAEKYSWFRVFSTENRGVGYARNYGAKMSRGEYLAFVDSDDEVEPDYCQAMYEKAVQDGNDMVLCWADRFALRDGQIIHNNVISSLVKEDNFCVADKPYILAKFTVHMWNKLIKRELFFRVLFAEGMPFSQDRLCSVELCCLAQKIGTVKRFLYHYYASHMGVTSRFGWERLAWVKCIEQMTDFMRERDLEETLYAEFEYQCIFYCIEAQKRIVRKSDGVWAAKVSFVRETQRFLRENYPDWRKNRYYLESLAEHVRHFRPAFYNYGERHLLILLYLSRSLPQILYDQIRRADRVLVFACRYVRWARLVSTGGKG